MGLAFGAKMSSAIPSSLCRGEFCRKTQLYLYGYAYRPHQSVTKTKLCETAHQTGGVLKRGFVSLCGKKTFLKRRFLKTIASRLSCDFHAQFSSNTDLECPVIAVRF